jgi:hypothetical protein
MEVVSSAKDSTRRVLIKSSSPQRELQCQKNAPKMHVPKINIFTPAARSPCPSSSSSSSSASSPPSPPPWQPVIRRHEVSISLTCIRSPKTHLLLLLGWGIIPLGLSFRLDHLRFGLARSLPKNCDFLFVLWRRRERQGGRGRPKRRGARTRDHPIVWVVFGQGRRSFLLLLLPQRLALERVAVSRKAGADIEPTRVLASLYLHITLQKNINGRKLTSSCVS